MIGWEKITIWYVAINLVLMLLYTIITAIGGAFDLIYLLRELAEKEIDETDNGRVESQ